MWLIYALICAFLTAGAALVEKKTLSYEHAMEFSANVALLNVLISLPFFFFIDYSRIDLRLLAMLFFITILAAVAFFLVAKSIRHMAISAAAPLLVIGPGITAIFAFVFLGEHLTIAQVAGIVIIIIGSYVLETRSHHDLRHPLRTFIGSKYIVFILLALLFYSITGVFDRFALSRYDFQPIAYLAFAQLFLGFHFLIMIILFHDGIFGIVRGLRTTGKWIFIVSLMTVGYRYAQMNAVKVAYVGLVLPIKRMSVFFTTIIGGEIFHEKNLLRKSIACLIMIMGVLLIAL